MEGPSRHRGAGATYDGQPTGAHFLPFLPPHAARLWPFPFRSARLLPSATRVVVVPAHLLSFPSLVASAPWQPDHHSLQSKPGRPPHPLFSSCFQERDRGGFLPTGRPVHTIPQSHAPPFRPSSPCFPLSLGHFPPKFCFRDRTSTSPATAGCTFGGIERVDPKYHGGVKVPRERRKGAGKKEGRAVGRRAEESFRSEESRLRLWKWRHVIVPEYEVT